MTPEELAIRFHETYERLAPSFGYETRPDTKAFDPTSPNGQLMIAVCTELLRFSAHEELAILEQAVIDASNGRFPPQGQADDDDALDGLAHLVYKHRKNRQ